MIAAKSGWRSQRKCRQTDVRLRFEAELFLERGDEHRLQFELAHGLCNLRFVVHLRLDGVPEAAIGAPNRGSRPS